jgi:hypothetical protein
MSKTAVLYLFAITACSNMFNPGGNCTIGSDLLCAECDGNTSRCKKCTNGYVDPKWGNCRPPSYQIQNCTNYAKHNMCGTCTFPGEVEARGTCKQGTLMANSTCAASSSGVCKYCSDLSKIPDAQGNCGTQECPVERCDLCNTQGNCDKCIEGFTLIENMCADREIDAFENCQVAESPDACQQCDPGYFVGQDQTCVQSNSPAAAQIMYAIAEAANSHPTALPSLKPSGAILDR